MRKFCTIARWRSLAAAGILLGATAASALAQGTADQRRLCAPDAIRLCQDSLPDVAKVTACMTAKKAELSEGCRNVMFAAKPARPVVAASHRHKTVRTTHAAHRTTIRSRKASCATPKGHRKSRTCKAVVRTRG
jgi:hypothetical protein